MSQAGRGEWFIEKSEKAKSPCQMGHDLFLQNQKFGLDRGVKKNFCDFYERVQSQSWMWNADAEPIFRFFVAAEQPEHNSDHKNDDFALLIVARNHKY